MPHPQFQLADYTFLTLNSSLIKPGSRQHTGTYHDLIHSGKNLVKITVYHFCIVDDPAFDIQNFRQSSNRLAADAAADH